MSLRRHVPSSARANDALHDMGPVLRCVRCGALDEDSRPWCRDDHDHQYRPRDHWLNRKWDEPVNNVVEHDLPHVTLHACVGCGNVSHDADTWSCEGPCHVLREGDAYGGPCAWIDGHEDTAPVEYVSVVEADGEAGLLVARCRGAAESLRRLADLLDAPDDNGSA